MNVALPSNHLNIISLCTGGFGLDHAVELAIPGARTVCMVEREAYACATLVSAMEAGLLARSPIWSDARTFDGRPWRGLVDGIIGGIPCQPHSLAGKRKGADDERDLWSAARRIFVQSGAWFMLIENVRGMLSSGGAKRVRRDLLRLGCEVEAGLFTASEVGASHERERLFILAVADSPFRRWLEGCGLEAQGLRCPEFNPAHGSSALANRDGERSEARFSGSQRRREGRPADQSLDGGGIVVHAEGIRRGARRAEPAGQCGKPGAPEPGGTVDDASIARSGGLPIQPRRQDEARSHTDWASASYLFPPGPNDRENWQAALERAPELEPSFRRVANGLASRLDLGRVDRLRLLGNGVLPLEGAYAVRTLATRLAARGSAGAARLVWMMEQVA